MKKVLIVAVVAAVFVAGCKRKTENGGKAGKKQQNRTTSKQKKRPGGQKPEAPPGMALIEGVGDEPIFIRREAVNVQEYVNFLESTGRPVPERYSGPGVDTDRPVTGLSLREARRLAKWMLGQLPSAREWQAAPDSVVSGAYPWRLEQGKDKPRPGARVYVVKHYRPGSKGEKQARKRKEKMLSSMLEARRKEVSKLRKQVTSDLEDIESNWQELWKQYKTRLFNYLKLRAKEARRQAEKTRKQTVFSIMNQLRERKIKNLIRLQQSTDTSEQAMQKAVKKYRNFLSQQVQKVKDKRASLEDAMSGMSDRVLEMKQKVENAGSDMLTPVLKSIQEELKEVPEKLDELEAAVEARNKLQETHDSLDTARKQVNEMKSRASEMQEHIKSMKQESEAKAEGIRKLDRSIEEEKDKLSGLSDTLDRSFDAEQELFDALQKLTEVSTEKRVHEAQMEELQSALEVLGSDAAGDAGGESEGDDTGGDGGNGDQGSSEDAGQESE